MEEGRRVSCSVQCLSPEGSLRGSFGPGPAARGHLPRRDTPPAGLADKLLDEML